MPTITVGEREIFYAQHGRGALSPALLLVHGAGGTHLDWPVTLRRFGVGQRTVYAIDLPGHGRSTGDGCDSIEEYAHVVMDWLQTINAPPVVVLGHSMGGAVALQLGLLGSAQLSGLVIVGSGARLPVTDVLLEGTLTDFDDAVGKISRWSWGPDAPAEAVALARQRLAETDPAVLHGDLIACNAFDARGRLSEIDLPALVIGGTADRMAPFEFSQTLADGLPNAQLVTLEGTGHMIPLERPTAVAMAVAEFLEMLD